MKVLHVVSSYWPAFEFGGPIQSVHFLNKFLVKEGVKVTVYTTNAGLERNKEIAPGKEIDLEGVKVFYFPYFGPKNYNFSPALFREIKKNIKNFDLVHLTGVWNFPVFAGAFWAKKFKKPHIISPRGSLYPETFKGGSFWKYLKKRINYFLFAEKIIKNASAVHFTTLDEAEKTKKFLNLKNNYFVIPNGLDLEEIYQNFPDKREFKSKFLPNKKAKYLLILGRLNWKKGFDILIPAFAEISKDFSDLYLVIVGPDEEGYKKKIEGWIRKFGIEEKVIFTGLLEGKEKWASYQDAEIFVLPSYSENFGMVVVEAMALGVPVVISDKVGIYREVEKNKAGIIVKPNRNSLLAGIKKVLEDGKLAQRIAQNGKRIVEKDYDIKEIAKRMKREYTNLLR